MYNDQYTDLILDYIQKQIPDNEQLPLKNIKVYDRYLSFKVYTKSTKFDDLIQNKLPLSSIYMTVDGPDNGINLVFKKSLNEKSIEALEIVFSDNDDDFNHLGHFYALVICRCNRSRVVEIIAFGPPFLFVTGQKVVAGIIQSERCK